MDLKGYSIESKKYQINVPVPRTKSEGELVRQKRREAAVKICDVAESPDEARGLLEMLGLLDLSLRAAQ